MSEQNVMNSKNETVIFHEDNMIELHHIKKSYDGENTVIDDINLDIKKGEFVTLLGPSGCGKTTILRMIAGFEIPTDGQILLSGKEISELPPNQRSINTVFQKYALFPHLNVYDNIAFGLKLKKLPKTAQDEKVRKALEMVDLEGFEKRSIHTLSGGQQQRIAIARAIVNEPKVLLLDEPLSALDYKMRKEMQMELKNMHRKLGITFIFVTHDQEEALTMSDKVVVMAHGAIQQVGTPEEIYNEPSNVFVADFIGQSNIFKGVMSGKFKARFCKAEFTCVDDYAKGTVIDAVIRPEDFVLTRPEEGIIQGKILSSDFKGTFYEVAVLCGKNEIAVHSLKTGMPGTKVGLTIEPDNIHIIPYDLSINHYEGVVAQNQEGSQLAVSFAGISWSIDPAQLFEGATMSEGVVVDADGEAIDLTDVSFEASFAPEHADLSDDKDAGVVQGNIVSFIYIDDHYTYTVRGLDEEDYIVDDEDLWNQNDFVSILIPQDKVKYKLL